MHKVLIVDDEPSIREGLKTLIDWGRLGFEICGEAANGKEGLRRCAELMPDLVLADIRMPGLDGIDMIEEARRTGLTCRFMVLTGYSEFQYAKRAINQGVECYLLKPIDAGELQLQVGRLQQELLQDLTVREQAVEGIARRTERDLQRLLSHSGSEERVSAYRELAGRLGFPWKSYRVLLVAAESNPVPAAVSVEAKELLRREIESRTGGYVCTMDEYTAVLLNETSVRSVKPGLDAVCQSLIERWGFGIWVYAGRAVKDAGNLSVSCESAMNLARNPFLYRPENGFWIEEADIGRNPDELPSNDAFDEDACSSRIAMAVDSGEPDVLRKEAKEAVRLIVRENGLEHSIKTRTAMLYMSVFHRLQAAAGELEERLAPFRTVPREWNVCRSLEHLREAFVTRLEQLSETMNRDRPAAALHRMLDFIRRHYDQDLKLETLAEMYHYNSGYLGKLFRQQTGEYFNTYLDRVRIENAKKLLKQGLKVHQVASKVGYCDVDYFHGKFKKYVGMPPSVFRQRRHL